MKTKKIIIFIAVLFVVLLTNNIIAFGIGAAYHKDNPLNMYPGETKEINFNLQNKAGSEPITVRPSIKTGSEFLKFKDDSDILVDVGGSIDITIIAFIPEEAKVGDSYPVEVEFTTVTSTATGPLGLSSSVGRIFNIIIVESPEDEKKPFELKNSLIYIIIGILALIIIAIIFLKKRK